VAVASGEGLDAAAGVAVGRGAAVVDGFGNGVGLRRTGEGEAEDRGRAVEVPSGRTVGNVMGARVIDGVASGLGVVAGTTLGVGIGEVFRIGG
jgi:hypothetical protein